MEKKLEVRIARLEKLLKIKNEGAVKDISGMPIMPGMRVEDIDGFTGKVMMLDKFGKIYDKFVNRLMPENREYLDDFIDEWGDEAFDFDVALVKYDDGELAICVDPENGLEIIEVSPTAEAKRQGCRERRNCRR